MDSIIRYILIGAGVLFVVSLISKVIAFYWKAGYEDRKKKREQKKIEKQKWKYANIEKGNPLLEKFLRSRFIVFRGEPGMGKTILANLTAHYLWNKISDFNRKHKRYNKYVNPGYLEEYEALKKKGKLPLYSNITLSKTVKNRELATNKKEWFDYFSLKKKMIYRGFYLIDEIARYFPKDMLYEQRANPDSTVSDIESEFALIRQWFDGYVIATDQNGSNIYWGFRQIGYSQITANGTVITLKKKAKFLFKLKKFLLNILPAFFTLNMKQIFRQELFFVDKIKDFFKAFIPAYFLFPREYYLKRKEIKRKIDFKYTQYQVHLEYEGAEYYLRFTNDDIFKYDTKEHKKDYDKMFDKNGNRIQIQEGNK